MPYNIINNNTIILDFSKTYPTHKHELIKSNLFKEIILNYLDSGTGRFNQEAFEQYSTNQLADQIILVFKQLLVFSIDDITMPIAEDKSQLLILIDDIYNYWKKYNRYSIVNNGHENAVESKRFLIINEEFNNLVRATYRTLEEQVRQSNLKVYRQIQAGTNGSVGVVSQKFNLPSSYDSLQDIKVIDKLMIRTPMMMYPFSNTRKGSFTKTDVNPITYKDNDFSKFLAIAIKVGTVTGIVYFDQTYLGNAIALANLFEIADLATIDKPDFVVLFGLENQLEETVYYHDVENKIFIGAISKTPYIDYFGYMKKMCLTLFNLIGLENQALPIHGAFLNIKFKNGLKKSVLIMGDSGAGKSETIEELQKIASDEIADIEIIFDDMGTVSIIDGVCYATGSEIGAFIRLDDLDKGKPYLDMDRSIFMNPDTNNARVIIPVCSYQKVCANHPIDLFLYANNYDNKTGVDQFNDILDAKDTFVEGKRMALGTTHEVGISTTYFANPFGPMQEQDKCDPLIDLVFNNLFETETFVGQIYTQLGFNGDTNALNTSAKQLLELLNSK